MPSLPLPLRRVGVRGLAAHAGCTKGPPGNKDINYLPVSSVDSAKNWGVYSLTDPKDAAGRTQLAHHHQARYNRLGERAMYSWFANVNAPYVVAWYDNIVSGRREQARQRQERMRAFMAAKRDTVGAG